jgi:NAD(P)-dependent dehydrogenase (short-subunit alcohol dehydrogenase family)
MLTRAIAAEFAQDGIIVVAISPGWVRTEMGGPRAPLSPEECAQNLFRTITQLKKEHSGMFLGKDGLSSEYQW